MTEGMDKRRDLHRRLRRVGIVSPPFTRRGGVLRTIAIGLSKKEQRMQDADQSGQWGRELPPPDGAEAEGSSEILRAWIVDGELGVSMRAGIVSHPVQWGGVLADLARYVMLLFEDGANPTKLQKVLDEVVRGFEERLTNPEQTHIEVPDGETGGS